MVTHIPPGDLDLQERFARIRQMRGSIVIQAMLATAALLGAGAVIAKLFFP